MSQKENFSAKDVSAFWDTLCLFFRARNSLSEKIKSFEANSTVSFDGFDEIVADLSQARLACHELFRDSEDKAQRPDDPGRLFDFVVSTIYHEMLHVKEYVYIINTYGQFYGAIDPDSEAFDDSLRHWVNLYTNKIYHHAETELPASFTNVSNLFESCETILKYLLPLFRESKLARIAYCNRASQTKAMFGAASIVKFFDLLYEGGAFEGFACVGLQLLDRGFYQDGIKACQHAYNTFLESPNKTQYDYIEKMHKMLSSLDYTGKTKLRLIKSLEQMLKVGDLNKK